MKQSDSVSQQGCLELCIQVGKQLYKQFDRRLEQLGLTPVQLQVLAGLAGGRWLTMGELSERLCCAGSNVTAVVGRMAEAGLVERRPDPSDRRSRRVRITSRGRTLLRAATHVPQCCPELGPLLSPAEWSQLCRLLGKLWSRMQTEAC
jgi:DNA-binding MarR family transcriptional regulator